MRYKETLSRRLKKVIQRPDRVRIAALTRLISFTGLPIETRIRLSSGRRMWIQLPDVVSINLAYEGSHEPEIATMLEEVLHPGSVFFDVGAHYGLNTLNAYDILRGDGHIVAFEPTPQTRRLLQRNCQEMADVVTIDDRVVSRTTGDELELSVFDARFSGCNTVETPRIPPDILAQVRATKILVPSVTLDDYYLATGLAPDVIKLDVENHEMAVLEGATDILKKYHPVVIMEIGDLGRGPHNSTEACLNFLSAMGYSFWQVDDGLLVKYAGDMHKENILAE